MLSKFVCTIITFINKEIFLFISNKCYYLRDSWYICLWYKYKLKRFSHCSISISKHVKGPRAFISITYRENGNAIPSSIKNIFAIKRVKQRKTSVVPVSTFICFLLYQSYRFLSQSNAISCRQVPSAKNVPIRRIVCHCNMPL